MKKITLYVDVVSPFAYIAYHVLRHDPVFKKCEITYIPVFLGGIMKTAGNTPPIHIKNKDTWIATERLRWARYFNVPIIPETPANFPPNTLTVMRTICAAVAVAGAGAEGESSPPSPGSPAAQALLTRALDAFYDAYWVQGRVITDKDVIADVLGKVLGSGGSGGGGGGKTEEVVARVLEEAGGESKRLLLRNTELAFAEGAFGLPWMVCENDKGEKEGFWGCDHLGCVVDFLGLEKPGTASWRAML